MAREDIEAIVALNEAYAKLSALSEDRVRVGDYRVIYEIRETVLIVLVVRIGHRREIYR